MRLTQRLDALARRLPRDTTDGEDAIIRAVFVAHAADMEATHVEIDCDEYTQVFDAAYAEHGEALLAEMERYFAATMAQEEAEQGPWMTIEGHGRIRERTYARLRARVTGGRDAAAQTP